MTKYQGWKKHNLLTFQRCYTIWILTNIRLKEEYKLKVVWDIQCSCYTKLLVVMNFLTYYCENALVVFKKLTVSTDSTSIWNESVRRCTRLLHKIFTPHITIRYKLIKKSWSQIFTTRNITQGNYELSTMNSSNSRYVSGLLYHSLEHFTVRVPFTGGCGSGSHDIKIRLSLQCNFYMLIQAGLALTGSCVI